MSGRQWPSAASISSTITSAAAAIWVRWKAGSMTLRARRW